MVPPTMSLAAMHGKVITPLIPFEYALKHERKLSRGEKEGINF